MKTLKTIKPLKRIALTLALIALCSGARAEWTEIQKFEDGMRVFVDAATARRNGDTAQVSHLVRWGEPQVEEGLSPYLSTVVLTSYDCLGKREKYLGSTSFAGAMGSGARILADEDEADGWYSISTASMEDKLWTIACAAK